MSIPQIPPGEAKRRVDQGSAVLIDIREPDEYAREHIEGARLVPLSRLESADFTKERQATAVIFHCLSGNRTCVNAHRLEALGLPAVYVMDGGLMAWKVAGLPTRTDRRRPIELQRQVMIAAGSIILLGVILAYYVSPWFIAVCAFMGCGLLFAGISGRCGLAKLLEHMPWNATT